MQQQQQTLGEALFDPSTKDENETTGLLLSTRTTSATDMDTGVPHRDGKMLVKRLWTRSQRRHRLERDAESLTNFFFPASNPTLQRYYRFKATPQTPSLTMYARPIINGLSRQQSEQVTGILNRSAVIPSHGTNSTGEYVLLSIGGRSGWARKRSSNSTATNSNDSDGFVSLATDFAASEAWMGNHAFFYHGKIMLGSDVPSLLVTNVSLLSIMAYYFALLVPELSTKISPVRFTSSLLEAKIIFWSSLVISVFSLTFLWIAALRDPGIIPYHSAPYKPPIPEETGCRYCATCNIHRPPRSKHCSVCNVCVTKLDHHCPWVGNCIGERNHGAFCAFLFTTLLLILLATTSSLRLILAGFLDRSETQRSVAAEMMASAWNTTDFANSPPCTKHTVTCVLWQTLRAMPLTTFFTILLLPLSWSLVALSIYHARLISQGQTTTEKARGVYSRGRRQRRGNPVYRELSDSNTSMAAHSSSSSNNNNDMTIINNNLSKGTYNNGNTQDCFGNWTRSNNPYNHGCLLNWWIFVRNCCRPCPPSRLPFDFSQRVIYTERERPESLWSTPSPPSSTSELDIV